MNLVIRQLDPGNVRDLDQMVSVLQSYAQDPMGGASKISDNVINRLYKTLPQQKNAVLFLAEIDGESVGIANCFIGYSTFKAKELINIHDLAVVPGQRGQGIGDRLLEAVTQFAKTKSLCKVTLEVRSDNRAKSLYQRHGFGSASYATQDMLSWEKSV